MKINKKQNSSQDKKMVRITPTQRYFLISRDSNGNKLLAMVQGKLTDEMVNKATKLTNKRFIELAQRFLDETKHEM